AFNNLFRSLQNQGGMNDDDHPAMRKLRQRFTTFNEQNPDNQTGLTYELQLSIWLGEDDLVEGLFQKLTTASPDNRDLGMAWADYFIKKSDYTRSDRAYARLLETYPDDPEIRIQYAQKLKQRNLYARVIELLGRFEFDYAEWPEAAAILSDSLLAEHRIAEAVETLESIPDASELPADIAKQRIKTDADSTLPLMKEYIAHWEAEQAIRTLEGSENDLPLAQIITPKGIIKIELFENQAPNTVANFILLADAKFYHGSTFHRVLPNFMSQGGDPNSKSGATGNLGDGNPGYFIPDEFGREDARKHFSGSLSMAKQQDIPNTGGCQFFITHTPTTWLNDQHTVFGRVIEGLNVARNLEEGDRIEAVMILRKRDHDYVPEKLSLQSVATPLPIGSTLENQSIQLQPNSTPPTTTQPGG
ncbi:MAG: peptidylprolyl isomerase, partial [Planctomycetota bacterium]|nr:peptidylprolyl isomerase [Planctomycetota bacterium]